MDDGTTTPQGPIARAWTNYRRRTIVVALLLITALATLVALVVSPQLFAAGSASDLDSSERGSTTQATASAEPSAGPAPNAQPTGTEKSSGSESHDDEVHEDETHDSEITDSEAQQPDAAAPQHLRYEGAGLDMPVLPLTPSQSDMASQSLVPPLTEDAYWITSYGQPGEDSQNTTYITGHSWENGQAPFNRISTQAEVGDTLSVTTAEGDITYVVDSVTTHDKNTLKNSDIWDIVPQRLVIISCYTEDLWGKNVVVTASPA